MKALLGVDSGWVRGGSTGDEERGTDHMRRFILLGAVVALLFLMAAPASAAKLTKETIKFTDGVDEVIPAGEVCDFPVHISESVKGTDTIWLDGEDFVKAHIKVNGTTQWSGPGGTAVEHWSWSGWFDGETGVFRQSGNVWNVHKNGLVLHDKGLIVFGPEGELLKVAGPHEQFFEGFEALCEAIG